MGLTLHPRTHQRTRTQRRAYSTHTPSTIYSFSLSPSNSLSLSLSFSLYLSTSQEVYKTYLSCTYVRVCECESLWAAGPPSPNVAVVVVAVLAL